MKKKLPNVYVNKQNKKINNNKETYYSMEHENEAILKKDKATTEYIDELLVRKKISDIFASSNFVYKVKVSITTDKGVKNETIIAKTHDSLITLNNEKIPIKEIKDLEIHSTF